MELSLCGFLLLPILAHENSNCGSINWGKLTIVFGMSFPRSSRFIGLVNSVCTNSARVQLHVHVETNKEHFTLLSLVMRRHGGTHRSLRFEDFRIMGNHLLSISDPPLILWRSMWFRRCFFWLSREIRERGSIVLYSLLKNVPLPLSSSS